MNRKIRTVFYFSVIIVSAVALSVFFTKLWGGKAEKLPELKQIVIENNMTVEQFGRTNNLPNPVLKEIFHLTTKSDLSKRLDEYGTSAQIESMTREKTAIASEHASKNWIKIPLKFLLWFLFLSSVFIFSRKRKITSRLRNGLYASAILIFGVIMGSDPGPMGTVKDAIHLYATTGAVFKPRIIALSVFLVMVFLANKYICAWGCQAGTLQDLLFRINQDVKRKPVMFRQVRLPFVLTNTIRITFLFMFTLAAFLWSLDIIEPFDPFKIYNPVHLGIAGIIFLAILFTAGMFVYRPWCHLFCPFGLAGWIVEKISLFKIQVDYKTCIACEKCSAACPSTVMGAILRQNRKTIPDCFACNTCIEVCPTGSVSFSRGKRSVPPAEHFNRKKKEDK